MGILESKFQKRLIDEIMSQYPGAVVLKNDPGYIQGIPDWTVLFENKWVTFEAKASRLSPRQPNQEYYVKLLNEMSYSSFVYPENVEAVLNEIHRSFRSRRSARISQR